MSTTYDEAPKSAYVKTDSGGIAGHPRGLMTLFFTEMWERFSYYGMRAILLLYMVTATTSGGLGFSNKEAAKLYALYTASVYFGSIPGGFIADKLLGAKMSVLIGGIIIAAGHFCLAVPQLQFFYIGLGLIVVGTGLLKPNISCIVGGLYGPGDPRRDGGFSIFYMGINLGAFFSPLVCGFLAQSGVFKTFLASHGFSPESSWHWGFAAAGVGMVFGLLQYVIGMGRLPNVGKKSSADVAAEEPLTRQDYTRLAVIGILFVFATIFWAAFEQAGSSLTLFADKLTDNSIFGYAFPSSWFQSVNALLIILLAPVFSWLWLGLGTKQPSSPGKFSFGLLFAGLGFVVVAIAALSATPTNRVGPGWLILVYLLHTIGELCLSPVGLSTVTKLAPAKLVGLMMGVWFLAASLGNYIGGNIAGMFDENAAGVIPKLFGGVALVTILSAGILVALTPMVRKMIAGRD